MTLVYLHWPASKSQRPGQPGCQGLFRHSLDRGKRPRPTAQWVPRQLRVQGHVAHSALSRTLDSVLRSASFGTELHHFPSPREAGLAPSMPHTLQRAAGPSLGVMPRHGEGSSAGNTG